MSRYEKIVHLPSLMVTSKTAQQIDALFDGLAEERLDFLIQQQIAQAAQLQPGDVQVQIPGTLSRIELAQRAFGTAEYREFLRRSYGAKYTYLSKYGSVEFLGENYSDEDIPRDLDCVMAEAWGPLNRHIAIHVKSQTLPREIKSPLYNRILIQSSPDDRAWVNNIYEQLSNLASAERNTYRDLVYRWLPLFTWAAFLSLIVLEYRLATWFRGFSWRSPLNGMELLLVFAVLVGDLVFAFQIFSNVLQHAFPYFEFEGNLSRYRVGMRKLIQVGLTALYTGAVVAIFYH